MITKAELKRYARLRENKEDLEKRIVELKMMAETISGIAYDGIKVQSPYNGSGQEKYMERIGNLIIRYEDKINEITALIERIESEISTLPDEDQLLVRLRYFDGLQCSACARKLHISESSFHRWHREVLGKLREG